MCSSKNGETMSLTATQLIGMEKQAALDLCKTEGVSARVEAEDDQRFMLTQDIRMGRLNLTILEGKVTSVRFG
jgi:hypothetical protein